MSRRREQGYILAAALVAMFVMSLTAVALISLAANERYRVVAAETRAVEEALLRGGVRLIMHELAQAPRSRRFTLNEDGTASFIQDDRTFSLHVTLERQKLDINEASGDAIELALQRLPVSPALASQLAAEVERLRAQGTTLTLVDDILPEPGLAVPCLHQSFTVFGGWDGVSARPVSPDLNQVIRPGTRLFLQLGIEGVERQVEAVILLVGSHARSADVMDLRFVDVGRDGAGEGCHG